MNAYTCSSALHLDRAARHEDNTHNCEVIATLWHEDGTETTHALLMSAPMEDDRPDFITAWDEGYYDPVDPDAFNAAMRDQPELGELDYWDGISDEFDSIYPPSNLILKLRAQRGNQ